MTAKDNKPLQETVPCNLYSVQEEPAPGNNLSFSVEAILLEGGTRLTRNTTNTARHHQQYRSTVKELEKEPLFRNILNQTYDDKGILVEGYLSYPTPSYTNNQRTGGEWYRHDVNVTEHIQNTTVSPDEVQAMSSVNVCRLHCRESTQLNMRHELLQWLTTRAMFNRTVPRDTKSGSYSAAISHRQSMRK